MINITDIYDEVGFIKNILQDGLSEKWVRDIKLLTRYYKSIGMKPREIIPEIKNKCLNNKKFNYNEYRDATKIAKICKTAYNSKEPLREIRYIDISREVLDWFLSLEDSYLLTDEEVAQEKKDRPGIVIKNNKIFNRQRVNLLFTLYIWTRIQESYTKVPNVHYIFNAPGRFKHDADLKPSFILEREVNFLYDCGFLSLNYQGGVYTKFTSVFEDIFSIPVTDENRVRIELLKNLKDKDGNILDETTGDLHNCGRWLDKQKYGVFICQGCGKEEILYKKSNIKRGRPRKYCDECAEKNKTEYAGYSKNNTNLSSMTRICVDCGREFDIESVKNNKGIRCEECRDIRRKEKEKERVERFRAKEKIKEMKAEFLND